MCRARGGEEVTRDRRKGCLEGRRRQKTPKNALLGLRWHKRKWRVARRRQVRLEVEAHGRKVLHVPSRAGAWDSGRQRRNARGQRVDDFLPLVLWENLKISSLRTWWYGRCRKRMSPEKVTDGEGFLTTMKVFWRREGWSESFKRWERWPEWNTVTERFPIIDSRINRK